MRFIKMWMDNKRLQLRHYAEVEMLLEKILTELKAHNVIHSIERRKKKNGKKL